MSETLDMVIHLAASGMRRIKFSLKILRKFVRPQLQEKIKKKFLDISISWTPVVAQKTEFPGELFLRQPS